MGTCNVVVLSVVFAFASGKQKSQSALCVADILFYFVTNVLVGHKLLAFGSRDKHTRILKNRKKYLKVYVSFVLKKIISILAKIKKTIELLIY